MEDSLIDWRSEDNHLLLNPRLHADDRRRVEALAEAATALRGHIVLSSSGTGGIVRLVALSKEAMLASAVAVNAHLESTSRDVWCCVLPHFHVGGLAIHARAFVSGARVVDAAWDARAFARLCSAERVTLVSLVPAQVHDLVAAKIEAPASLRAVVVGGGTLSPRTFEAGLSLGWPLLTTYGMTECSSQVATAMRDVPDLLLLSHLEGRVVDGRLAFRGSSLLTGYVEETPEGPRLRDPKDSGGWFVTDDLGSVDGRCVTVVGRAGDVVKIGGELVDLFRLDAVLQEVAGQADAAIVAAADKRLGAVVHLAVATGDEDAIAEAFNARVLPFERIRRVHRVASIPRSMLGKLLRVELTRELAQRGGAQSE